MNKADIGFDRLSTMIQKDKNLKASNAINEVLKSDFINLMENYFEVYDDTAEVEIDVINQNDINIYFAIKANRMKDFFNY